MVDVAVTCGDLGFARSALGLHMYVDLRESLKMAFIIPTVSPLYNSSHPDYSHCRLWFVDIL